MAQYFTTYNSREAIERQQRYVRIAAFGTLALIVVNSTIGFKNWSNIIDLNTEVTFHRHQQTTGQHTDVAVNSNLEPLYLSGAWF